MAAPVNGAVQAHLAAAVTKTVGQAGWRAPYRIRVVTVAFARQAAVNDHDLVSVGVVFGRVVPGTLQRETEAAIRRPADQRAGAGRRRLPQREGRYHFFRFQFEYLQLVVLGIHDHQAAGKLLCMFVGVFVHFRVLIVVGLVHGLIVDVLVHVRIGVIAVVTAARERQHEKQNQYQS